MYIAMHMCCTAHTVASVAPAIAVQALDCFQKANKAAGGNAEYAARVRSLKLKTSSQRAQVGMRVSPAAQLQPTV